MNELIRIADNKGRVILPGFANAAVILEAVNANEYRVRKAEVIAADDLRFPETEMPVALTRRDAERLAAALTKPPPPNAVAKRAAKRFRKRHG